MNLTCTSEERETSSMEPHIHWLAEPTELGGVTVVAGRWTAEDWIPYAIIECGGTDDASDGEFAVTISQPDGSCVLNGCVSLVANYEDYTVFRARILHATAEGGEILRTVCTDLERLIGRPLKGTRRGALSLGMLVEGIGHWLESRRLASVGDELAFLEL